MIQTDLQFSYFPCNWENLPNATCKHRKLASTDPPEQTDPKPRPQAHTQNRIQKSKCKLRATRIIWATSIKLMKFLKA